MNEEFKSSDGFTGKKEMKAISDSIDVTTDALISQGFTLVENDYKKSKDNLITILKEHDLLLI